MDPIRTVYGAPAGGAPSRAMRLLVAQITAWDEAGDWDSGALGGRRPPTQPPVGTHYSKMLGRTLTVYSAAEARRRFPTFDQRRHIRLAGRGPGAVLPVPVDRVVLVGDPWGLYTTFGLLLVYDASTNTSYNWDSVDDTLGKLTELGVAVAGGAAIIGGAVLAAPVLAPAAGGAAAAGGATASASFVPVAGAATVAAPTAAISSTAIGVTGGTVTAGAGSLGGAVLGVGKSVVGAVGGLGGAAKAVLGSLMPSGTSGNLQAAVEPPGPGSALMPTGGGSGTVWLWLAGLAALGGLAWLVWRR